MDGVYDLGGAAGFGTIEVEEAEPTFHSEWEAAAFRLNVASIGMLGAYNADEYRHAIERMDPVHYLQAPYYERVLTGVTTLLVEKGILELHDLQSRVKGRFPLANPICANIDDGREEPNTPIFNEGASVRVRVDHQPGHTRVPKYCRGKAGVVIHVAPPFSFPDASAHGLPRRRECTYHVEFEASELWGDSGEAQAPVVIDLWETYLEEVP